MTVLYDEALQLVPISPPQASGQPLVMKLAAVMAAIERIQKRGHNDFHNYNYATEADIVTAIRIELASRHIMLLPAITGCTREHVGEKGMVLTTLTMEFTFLDGVSGETLTRPWLGAGTDKEDKGAYKAMTGGEKYFLLKTFLIPTGDDPEANDAAKESREKRTQRAPAPIPAPQAKQPPGDREGPAAVNHYVGVHATPRGDVAVNLPEGVYRILAVKPGSGKVVGDLDVHTGETFPMFQEGVKAVAEQACRDGVPVRLDIKVSGTSGKSYIKAVHPVTDQPF